jgi:hypothetical protein
MIYLPLDFEILFSYLSIKLCNLANIFDFLMVLENIVSDLTHSEILWDMGEIWTNS